MTILVLPESTSFVVVIRNSSSVSSAPVKFWFDQGLWREKTVPVQRALTSSSGMSPAR